MNADIIQNLRGMQGVDAEPNVNMSAHTTFKTGGSADVFIKVSSEDGLCRALSLLKREKIDYSVIGGGANTLVSDAGFRGAIVNICIMGMQIDNGTIYCGAGEKLISVANAGLRSGLCGMEFAAGIPGTVGGGVYMNAGAYDGELGNFITKVHAYGDEKIQTHDRKDLEFSYRHSTFAASGQIITGVEFILQQGDAELSKQKTREFSQKRRASQPLEFPSAGSTFKRPTGHYAGALIEQAGLKGFGIGDAQVSEKHAGFIINRGDATSAQIYELICEVQKRVYEVHGVRLEREVRLLGDF